MSLNDVEQNLQQFVAQLDSFSEAVRQCQRELSAPFDEVTAVLPHMKAHSYHSLSTELDTIASKLTHSLAPGLQSGLEYRLHLLRNYLHE
ncbi:hypothetical protein [Photobacterium galatheae]|uniref:Uncharacterized protein n=1 Tax=Photobacterium galatheae TaxID=1654360 RepID=A0A066RHD8_9GAMM|nr:hypothetical protein [Photobacterium galatheae]KDM89865.1 hypothetical protein EA58_20660 [Photobacterium galatheae]MCM0151160.1 hypothetical protein [Photobacterium galatheae]